MKNIKRRMAWTFPAVLCLAGNPVTADTPQPVRDPAVRQYLDCINSTARQQQTKGSDKLSNPQAVIDSCASQKAALLGSRTNPGMARFVAQIEQHLKSRQKR